MGTYASYQRVVLDEGNFTHTFTDMHTHITVNIRRYMYRHTYIQIYSFLSLGKKAVYLYVCMSVHIPAYVYCYVCMYVCKCMCKVPLIQYFSLVLCIRVYCLCIIFSTSPPPPSPINRQIGRYTYINSKRVF